MLYPTTHMIVDSEAAEGLPVGSSILPVDWPDDGRPKYRLPITHVLDEHGGHLWTDGRTSSPLLDPKNTYRVLYVPFPAAVADGSPVERWMLDRFEGRTVVRDRDGWVAQLDEVDEGLRWMGLINGGQESMDNDYLWEEGSGPTGGLVVVSIPRDSVLHPDHPKRPENQVLPT